MAGGWLLDEKASTILYIEDEREEHETQRGHVWEGESDLTVGADDGEGDQRDCDAATGDEGDIEAVIRSV